MMSAVPPVKAAILSGGLSPIARAARWGVVGAWNGDTLSDAFDANHLTNNNGVTFTAGKGGDNFTFNPASSQSLSIVDNAALSVGDRDLWFACWPKVNDAASRIIAGKETNNTNAEWRVDQFATGPVLRLITWKSGAVDVVLSSAVVTTGVPHFVMACVDTVNNVARLSVDGGAFVQANMTGPTYDSTAPFRIGSGAATGFMSGQVGLAVLGIGPPLGIAALATEIRDYLHNSGNGRRFPEGWT